MKEFIKKNLWWMGILFGGAAVLWGSYLLTAKFLKDRNRTLSYVPPAQMGRRTPSSQGPVRKVYTQKELEAARKRGEMPRPMAQPYIPPAQNPNDAAIQRTMRTLEEINKVNEMNQKLMDQQRRMQNLK